jgi:hypothetical protein
MEHCEKCTALQAEILRLTKKLSPLVDLEWANTYFYPVEPIHFYRKGKVIMRQHEAAYTVTLREVWDATPGLPPRPSPLDLTKLGRAMDAKGWERTKTAGQLRMVMRVSEFQEVYGG